QGQSVTALPTILLQNPRRRQAQGPSWQLARGKLCFPNHVTCAPHVSCGGQAERCDEQEPQEKQSHALVARKAHPEWIKKMWSIYTMEYFSTIRKDEYPPFASIWTEMGGGLC
ncbi:unnamed protein product, partial [Gulo gulo]